MSAKKKVILIIIGAILLKILIDIGIVLFFSSGFNDEYEITTNVSKYNEVITGEKWGLSEDIFPSSIENLNVQDFKHVYYNPWDANYLAYLVIDYSEEEYSKEVERLNSYGIDNYIGYYSVTGFTKYTLLAMKADSYNGFVYALTDNKSKIIYVELIFCNYYMDIKYDEQIPSEYLPDNFDATLDNPYQKSN